MFHNPKPLWMRFVNDSNGSCYSLHTFDMSVSASFFGDSFAGSGKNKHTQKHAAKRKRYQNTNKK